MALQLKMHMSFFFFYYCFCVVRCVVQDKPCIAGLCIVTRIVIRCLVEYRRAITVRVTHYVAKDSFRAIYYEIERRFVKSIFIPKIKCTSA